MAVPYLTPEREMDNSPPKEKEVADQVGAGIKVEEDI
jgi:hypothetical protein